VKATASTTGHSDESTTIRATLERKSLGELRILAKKLALSGYSSLRKADLIDYLTATDPEALSRLLFPNWWAAHHNHVYGAITILGVALAVAFFVWQQLENSRPTATEKLGPSTRIVTSIETPIRFADFAAGSSAELATPTSLPTLPPATGPGHPPLFWGLVILGISLAGLLLVRDWRVASE